MDNKYDYNKICTIKELCQMLGFRYDKYHSKRSLEEIERNFEIEKISDRKYRLVKEFILTDKEIYKNKNYKYYKQCNYDKFTVDWNNKEGSGIYKIQLNNMVYIGQTNNFKNRYNKHRRGESSKRIKEMLDLGATFDLLCYEDDLEKRLLKESAYAIEYKLNGFNVINDFNRIVKENYRKQRIEKFITIKIKFNDLSFVLDLLKDNNIFAERVTKAK